jgi:hypothetical protein
VRAVRGLDNEASVKLDFVEWKAAQVAQGGKARPKVIHSDPDAKLAKF